MARQETTDFFDFTPAGRKEPPPPGGDAAGDHGGPGDWSPILGFPPPPPPQRGDGDPGGGWFEIVDVSGPGRNGRADDDDDGLPDTIIWCIDGDGDGSGDATGAERFELTFETTTRTWSIDGEAVDGAGLSALLFL